MCIRKRCLERRLFRTCRAVNPIGADLAARCFTLADGSCYDVVVRPRLTRQGRRMLRSRSELGAASVWNGGAEGGGVDAGSGRNNNAVPAQSAPIGHIDLLEGQPRANFSAAQMEQALFSTVPIDPIGQPRWSAKAVRFPCSQLRRSSKNSSGPGPDVLLCFAVALSKESARAGAP